MINEILKFLLGLILIGCGTYFLIKSIKSKPFTFNNITLLTGSSVLIIVGFFLIIETLFEFLA
jgi:hypothetical protein